MKKVYHAHSKHNETGEAILISSKIDFKTKSMIRAKDDIMIKKKKSHSLGRHIIVNVQYMFNNRVSKCMKQKLTEINREIVENVNLSATDGTTRQKSVKI